MDHLLTKYKKDKLTPEELSELRKNAASMTDEEVERQLYEDWLNDDVDTSSVDDGMIDKQKQIIDAAIGRKRFSTALLVRRLQIAATLLLPISLLFTFYFYRENHLILSDEIVVTTGKTERANIKLPDGTVAFLNAESTLEYHPKTYNKKERTIKFSGEGYFQVYRNEGVPFFINAKGLQVEVFGTSFNLSVRENHATAELALEEGSVSLLSVRNNRNVVLMKNQKAILNHLTGDITVITDENIGDVSAWRKGDMVFRNTQFEQVIHSIEKNYNVTITLDCPSCYSDRFTGTLPINDLNEVLEVIEHSYHLKVVINRKEICMKKN